MLALRHGFEAWPMQAKFALEHGNQRRGGKIPVSDNGVDMAFKLVKTRLGSAQKIIECNPARCRPHGFAVVEKRVEFVCFRPHDAVQKS